MPRNASIACLGLILASYCLAQAPTANEKATISGTVTSTSGQPVGRATVQLGPAPAARRAPTGFSAATETDSQGAFTFDDVAPGRYSMTVERTGYLRTLYTSAKSTWLTVGSGEHVTGISILMTPQGIVAGKVFDDEDQPFPDAIVNIRLMKSFPDGRQFPFLPGLDRTTDADGAFAVGNLMPGKYMVSASAPPNTGLPVKSSGAGRHEIYVRTFYPNGTATAAVVDVSSGGQVRGLEIHLQRAPVFKISGTVVNAATGEPSAVDSISLIRQGTGAPGLSSRSAGLKTGEFSFDEVLPGEYALETKPALLGADGPPVVGWQIISVGDEDLDRVLVEMKPAIEVTGKVVVEGQPPESWPQVTLTPTEGLNYPDFAPVDADGRFALPGLEPAPYKVNVGPVSAPYFVKAVRLNGGEIEDQSSIDLASAPKASLEIVISDKATGSISGVVTGAAGSAEPGLMVGALNRQVSGPVPLATTDDNGRYLFQKLPPGEYLIVAMDQNLPLAPGVFEKLAKRVTIADGAAVTVDLRSITMADVQAADSH